MNLTKSIILPGKTIGIIGGGQLGRMMALAAKEAGFRIVVLEPGFPSPCGQVADEQIIASYDDRDALLQLAEKSDVITYEFENIDYEALQWLTEKAYVPQGADIIKITQNRILEKQALVEAGVKVAPYAVIDNMESLLTGVEEIGFPCVLKTSIGGYDGKGQFVIRRHDEINAAGQLLEHGPCVLESWLPFEKEISVIVTRSIRGDMTTFPVAENIHVNNILHETIAPARIVTHVHKKAVALAKKIASHLELIGTLAVEMFLTRDGELYVNELAPRPHNSGHYTIEACDISQFGQHVRAVCNWPLKEPELLKPVVMVNILGQHVKAVMNAIAEKPTWSIHLYGKEEAKQNRKMGHITILTDDIDKTVNEIETRKIWISALENGGIVND
ncbi:5-(carboxyamino)imidazole ribonucleotide synthase [Bacillus chungangensis]|uniref:5-(carboxyamino)imidazole ribonucleotide synthase n=1 Tax=Bacillus chungangensis TaxID=587633 RepID=UPI0027D7A66E|nr:5-(carboxyamino)imidazole ribonucleotide synthase [Bacillus chungangensis]